MNDNAEAGRSGEFISPDEALRRASETMLEGREPSSAMDWVLVLNCLAANMHSEIAEDACILMRAIYEIPVSVSDIREICRFQANRQEAQRNGHAQVSLDDGSAA